MGLIRAFVDNPVKVAVGVLLVALFGIVSLGRMPMQLTPEVQVPTLTVETRWPGASPQEVEREIVQEQEEQLKGVEGMRKMTSECFDSLGRITMEFEIGTHMAQALLLVNSRLQQVPQYPEEANEPVISTSNSSDRPIAWFILKARIATAAQLAEFVQQHPDLAGDMAPVLAAHNSGLRYQRLQTLLAERPDLAETLQPLMPPDLDVPGMRKFAEDYIEAEFERVKGVSNANVLGGREEEVQVIVDPQRLAARELTILDVRRALRETNKDTSAGDVWEGKRRWVVRTLGQYRNTQQVANTIIARRDGRPVYVRDVADVEMGFKKPDGLVRNFGSSAIAINCLRSTGANVLDVMDGLRATNQRLNDTILKQRGLQLEQVYDETDYIYSSIGLVQSNIVIGGLLTVGVLLLFLRTWRSTLVIGLAIPTSIVGTFLMMNLWGRSLNVISLAGLAFAVGMLVDNAVVVLENIFRRYQEGEDKLTASVRGANEVWGAVVASTLTTLAVFLPVMFVQQEAGQLFRDIALAISAAVGLSMLVSVVVIPPATARILAGGEEHAKHLKRLRQSGKLGASVQIEEHTPPHGRLLDFVLHPIDVAAGMFVNLVVGVNRLVLSTTFGRVAVSAGFVATSLALSWLMMPSTEYLPNGNRNLVIGMLLPPPGYNLDRLTEMGISIEEQLRPYWDVDPGSPEARQLDFPPVADFFFVARGRQVFFGIRAQDPLRAGELVPLVQRLFGQVPGAFGLAFQSSLFESGLSAGRSIDVEFTGPELERLIELAGGTLVKIRGNEQVAGLIPAAQVFPKPSLDLTSPELHVLPKWDQAADMGVNAADLGYIVDALVDGAKATDYYVGASKIDLSIVGEERLAARTHDVETLPIATPMGDLVPLAAVADVWLGSGPEQINHRERQRCITLAVTPPDDMALEQAMTLIRDQLVLPLQMSGELDGGYQITLAGTADKLGEAWEALWFNLVLALVITYLLMAALFESWLYPLVIILSVPLGAVGGLLGLWTLNNVLLVSQKLDVLTMLGFVILIGTVVNNPILIVHQSLNYMREQGLGTVEAILTSVRTRVRPIFMTTTTTVLGLLPLVLIPGAGSELYRGLGSVVLGGLLVSTVFTLFLVPALFVLAVDTRDRIAQWLYGEAAAAGKAHGMPRPMQPEADGIVHVPTAAEGAQPGQAPAMAPEKTPDKSPLERPEPVAGAATADGNGSSAGEAEKPSATSPDEAESSALHDRPRRAWHVPR